MEWRATDMADANRCLNWIPGWRTNQTCVTPRNEDADRQHILTPEHDECIAKQKIAAMDLDEGFI
jgi:hypothetical protein